MSDLAKFDDGLRPALLPEPFQVKVWTYPAIGLASLCLAALVGVECFLIGQLLAEGGTATAWARFILPNLVVPYLFRVVQKRIESLSYRLTLKEFSLQVQAPRKASVEVRYEAIDELDLWPSDSIWLQAKSDGREIAIPSAGLYLTAHPSNDIVRIAGARLRSTAILQRGDAPEEPIDRLFWDHLYDPPAIKMEPGRRYRYIDQGATGVTSGGMIALMPLGLVTVQLGKVIASSWAKPATLLVWITLYAAYLWPFIAMMRRQVLIKRSMGDRFEIAPDGLWVMRGERRWKLSHPQWVAPIKPIKDWSPRRILRYGRGWNAYFFDPRLLEEDLPET